jgi:putative membrane protein
MEQLWPQDAWASRAMRTGTQYGAYGCALAVGGLLWWLSADHPAALPAWMPWDFSAPEYLATALVLIWFVRGLTLAPEGERLPVWRRVAFALGLFAVYAVLQTHFEYWAQHMFFLNRIQHVVMHHFGPFLMALAGAGATLRRGMPSRLRRSIESRPVRAVMGIVQQPALAAFLFVGLFAFWLIPSVHFRAMLDARLYALMNWSMVLDGVLFWSLVLDRRPKPPARTSYGVRAALALGVMFPQIVLGAIIGFSSHDLYPYYDLCGRILPAIGAINDQHIGGIIIWIPPAMMSVIGLLVVVNALRAHEDSIKETDPNAAALAALSSRWTGR